jgi:protoheme IX farnesyltransferase
MRAFRALSVAAAAATYALVVLGGVVRVTGSGLGCPDWPLCHGRLLPPLELHAVIEYAHRSAGALAGTLIVATALFALIRLRRRKDVLWPASLSLGLFIFQVVLGAITVRFELPPGIVLAHLATAIALLGALCATATAALTPPSAAQPPRPSWVLATPVSAYLLMLSGSLVVSSGASGSCSAWPLCGGGFSISLEQPAGVQLFHRAAAAVLGALIVIGMIAVLRRHEKHPAVRTTVALTLAALLAQVAVGAAVVTLHLPPLLRGLHLALGSAVWVGAVILSLLAYRLPVVPEPVADRPAERRPRRPVGEIALDYLSLAKPRIILLLLVTALGGMMIASRGWPSTTLVLLTLLGGALAAGGAGAINCWIDRDIDGQMLRTRRRPLPDGRIAPANALIFGIGLGVASFLLLAFFVNLLAATLAITGLLFYVFVYTVWLKRATPQNIVIGGAAGAIPPLVGWAAVTNGLDLTAVYLFAIIFFWTPPHFWALALRIRPDYARAGVPMLPVVRGDGEARRQILWYTLILVAVTLMLFVTGALGLLYLVGALLLGAVFIAFALLNLLDRRLRWSRSLFNYSIAYLAAIFAVMVVDRSIDILK